MARRMSTGGVSAILFPMNARALAATLLVGASIGGGPAVLAKPSPALTPAQEPTISGPGQAYYEFLLGKIRRFDGDLSVAIEHLSRAAVADDSSTIRAELAETYLRLGDLTRAIEQAQLATQKNPDDLEARRMLAETYVAAASRGPDKEGSTSLAIAEIRNVLQKSPGENDLRLTLGRLLLQQDRADEALAEFRTLRAGGADPAQMGLLIGRSLLRDGRRDEAESEIRSVLVSSPRNYEALLTLSQISEDREDWPAAAGYYGRLVEIRPSDNSLRARLGYTMLRAGKTEESIVALREACARNPSDRPTRELLVRALRASSRPGEALHELEVLLEYRPEDPRLLIQAARLHEDRGEVEQALEAYRRAAAAIETGATDDGEPLEEKVKQGLTLAIAALEIDVKNPSAALHTLSNLPKDNSQLGLDAAVLRVRALSATGDSAEAIRAAEQLEAIAPEDQRGALLRLEARLAKASPEEAEIALAEFRADKRSPREVIAATELLRAAGHGKLGLSILERALRAHPQDPSMYFAMGALYERLGNFRKAESLMERVIEMDPKEGRALNYLGYSLADRGKELARAEALIRRALAVDPGNGAYLDSLGWVLVKLGRLDEAEAALLRAADLVAGDATVREHLGDLYMKKNDRERALAEWRTAQGLRPEDPESLRKKILKASQEHE